MRGLIPGLATPHPLAEGLPGPYHDDPVTMGFVGALDEALAPVLATIDNLEAIIDPALTPADFLPWLASWVGLVLDENWSQQQQRRMISQTVELYRLRGTRRGIVRLVSLYVGVEEAAVEVADTGGVAWSVEPGGTLPGEPRPAVTVRIRVADPEVVDTPQVRRLVASAVPAHVACTVEVVST